MTFDNIDEYADIRGLSMPFAPLICTSIAYILLVNDVYASDLEVDIVS